MAQEKKCVNFSSFTNGWEHRLHERCWAIPTGLMARKWPDGQQALLPTAVSSVDWRESSLAPSGTLRRGPRFCCCCFLRRFALVGNALVAASVTSSKATTLSSRCLSGMPRCRANKCGQQHTDKAGKEAAERASQTCPCVLVDGGTSLVTVSSGCGRVLTVSLILALRALSAMYLGKSPSLICVSVRRAALHAQNRF